jgi:hypothetical protein
MADKVLQMFERALEGLRHVNFGCELLGGWITVYNL